MKVGRIVFVAFVVLVVALGCLTRRDTEKFRVSGGGIEVEATYDSRAAPEAGPMPTPTAR